MDGALDDVASEVERAAFGCFHQVGVGGGGGSGRDVEFDGGSLPAHSYMRKMRALESSAFLTAVRTTLSARRRAKECSAGSVPVCGVVNGGEWVVEFVAVADGEGLLPGAGVRVEGVVEVMVAAVGIGIGPGGRAEEREAEDVADGVVAEL